MNGFWNIFLSSINKQNGNLTIYFFELASEHFSLSEFGIWVTVIEFCPSFDVKRFIALQRFQGWPEDQVCLYMSSSLKNVLFMMENNKLFLQKNKYFLQRT